jgi:hypothetical protein
MIALYSTKKSRVGRLQPFLWVLECLINSSSFLVFTLKVDAFFRLNPKP